MKENNIKSNLKNGSLALSSLREVRRKQEKARWVSGANTSRECPARDARAGLRTELKCAAMKFSPPNGSTVTKERMIQ